MIKTILLVVALILFILDAIGISAGRIKLSSAGLAFLAASFLF